jgi:hypothetical protein
MITEALLEMLFLRPIADAIEACVGAKFVSLFKPSPRQEAWVGFDQSWSKYVSMTEEEFYTRLKGAVKNQESVVPDFYFGFFLQFKKMLQVRNSRHIPPSFTFPYIKADLSLNPIPTTGLSQHETLLRLSRINGSNVFYACPMVFDKLDVWPGSTLSQLKLVDITSSPSGWATNGKHSIVFKNSDDLLPFWYSEPIQAKAITMDEWIKRLLPLKKEGVELIQESAAAIEPKIGKRLSNGNVPETAASVIPDSFTVLGLKKKANESFTAIPGRKVNW